MAWFKREQSVDVLRQVPEAHRPLLEEALRHSDVDPESLQLVSLAPTVNDERVERRYGGELTIAEVLTEVTLRGADRETAAPVDFIIEGRVDHVPHAPPYDSRMPTAEVSTTLQIVVGEQEVARLRRDGLSTRVEHLRGFPPQYKWRQDASLRHTGRQLRATIAEATSAHAAGPAAPVLSSLDTAAAARFDPARSELEL
jgi:hypothetical protein